MPAEKYVLDYFLNQTKFRLQLFSISKISIAAPNGIPFSVSNQSCKGNYNPNWG